jgi:hypothetical protein
MAAAALGAEHDRPLAQRSQSCTEDQPTTSITVGLVCKLVSKEGNALFHVQNAPDRSADDKDPASAKADSSEAGIEPGFDEDGMRRLRLGRSPNALDELVQTRRNLSRNPNGRGLRVVLGRHSAESGTYENSHKR